MVTLHRDDRPGLVAISSKLRCLINRPFTHDNEISNNNHTNVYISYSMQEVKNIDKIENNGNIENGVNASELCNQSNENIQLNVCEVTHTFNIVCSEECDVLKSKLKTFWDLDTVEIKEREISVYDRFVDEIEFRNACRYKGKLPLKKIHPVIEDNYMLTVRRVKSVKDRLRKNPDTLKEYDKIIKAQLEVGIVEMINDEDKSSVGMVIYLFHLEVIREEKKSTKLRIVYDAMLGFK